MYIFAVTPGLLFELHLRMGPNTQFVDTKYFKNPLLCVIFVFYTSFLFIYLYMHKNISTSLQILAS